MLVAGEEQGCPTSSSSLPLICNIKVPLKKLISQPQQRTLCGHSGIASQRTRTRQVAGLNLRQHLCTLRNVGLHELPQQLLSLSSERGEVKLAPPPSCRLDREQEELVALTSTTATFAETSLLPKRVHQMSSEHIILSGKVYCPVEKLKGESITKLFFFLISAMVIWVYFTINLLLMHKKAYLVLYNLTQGSR